MITKWIKRFFEKPKIKVAVFTNFASQKDYRCELKKYYGSNYRWNDLYLSKPGETADYYVVVNFTSQWPPPSKTLLFQSEWDGFIERFAPNDWKQLPKDLLGNMRLPLGHTLLGWSLTSNFEKLQKSQPKKTKILSAVISNKNELELQKKRLNFALNFLVSLPCFDHYGQIHLGEGAMAKEDIPPQGFNGGTLQRKEDGLFPYRYTFASENSRSRNYITEKLIDAILCETLCFYDGCPNAEDFIHPEAFIRINLDEPKAALDIVRKSIENNEWEKRLKIIRAEKDKILKNYHLLARVESFLAVSVSQ